MKLNKNLKKRLKSIKSMLTTILVQVISSCWMRTPNKGRYFSEQGKQLLDPSLGAKKYWSLLNDFLQKK